MGQFWKEVFLFQLLILGLNEAAKKRLVCEQLDDIFSDEDPDQITPQSTVQVQGPPGKKGPPGPKGDRGIQGPPGPPDMTEAERLERAISEIERTTEAQLQELKRTIKDMQSSYVSRELLESCDFFHKGKCYALLVTTSRMDINDGKAACSQIHGSLANVHDEVQFEKMRGVMRSRIPIGHHYNHVWTGMTVDIQIRRIRLADGRWAPWVKWYPSRPYPTARKHVGIHVEGDPNLPKHGMFDEAGSYRLLGAWCEI